MRKFPVLIVGVLLLFSACHRKHEEIKISVGTVFIEGSITDYKGVYKTGKFTYFDAVTRIVNDEIFAIDSLGNFHFSFELSHPIIGSAFFDVENNFYSDFYIEPDRMYRITINNNKLVFDGDLQQINDQINAFHESVYKSMGADLKKAETLHEKGLPIGEYLRFQKKIENKKISYLNDFEKLHSVPDKVFKVLESEIKFSYAHAWINYRYDYSSGMPGPRDTLQPDFYTDLFRECPVISAEDFQTRMCIDYISNIVSVLEKLGATVEARMDFYKSYGDFKVEELKLLAQGYAGNTEIIKSREFAQFNSVRNISRLRNWSSRFNVFILLNNMTLLDPAIGRDLVISQAVSKNLIQNNLEPTVSEWERIRELIGNKSVFDYIKAYSKRGTIGVTPQQAVSDSLKVTLESVRRKFIDTYRGKVIYVDFYATWCGPCRDEIPFAESLHQEFKNSGVVFLNLCAQSEKGDWENLLRQKKIGGENFLLTGDEFAFLSKMFNIKGFPTYILIDKKGAFSNLAAPRPSSKQTINAEINRLLRN